MTESFGERVRRKRKAKHLSLDVVAAFLGTTRDILSRWERDIHVPADRQSVEWAVDVMPVRADLGGLTAAGFVFALKRLAGDRALADELGKRARAAFLERHRAPICMKRLHQALSAGSAPMPHASNGH